MQKACAMHDGQLLRGSHENLDRTTRTETRTRHQLLETAPFDEFANHVGAALLG